MSFGNTFGSGGFGNQAKPSFGFGASGTTSPSTFGFGSKPAQTNAFGGGGNAFGAAPSNNAFGAPANSAFGAPAGGAFGAPANTAFGASNNAFGGQTSNAFGAPATNAFGAPAANAFGAQSSNAFGGTGFGKPAFSTASSVTTNLGGLGGGGFGSGGGFGATSTPAFGRPAGTTSPSTGFGGGNAFGGAPTSGFGTSAFGTNTTGGFGTSATVGGAFGGGTSSPFNTGFGGTNTQQAQTGGAFGGFGQTAAPSFGQQPTAGAFGQQPTAAFGATTGGAFGGGFGQQQTQTGTGNPKFSPFSIAETTTKAGHQSTTNLSLQVITAMPQYASKSLEELRFEDYQRGNKGGNTGGGAFGGLGGMTGGMTSPFKQQNAFGAAPTTNMFGAPAATGFGGAASTGAFGQPAAGAFGAPAATSGFGFGQQTAAPAFGQAAPAFGQSASTGFGQPATSGFGQPTATGFGQTTGGFGSTGFGQTAAPAFGQQAAPAFGQTAAPAFGQPATTGFGQTTGGFGSTGFGQTAAPAFGQQAAPAFGQTTAPAFGQPQATTGFGQTPAFGQPAATGFGQPAATGFGQTTGGFGSTGFGQTAAPAFGQTAAPAFGQQAAPAFGASVPAAGGLSFGGTTGGFGSTTATGGFGQSTLGGFGQTQPATGGFGGFGAVASTTPAFGAPAASTSFGGFGSTPTPAATGFGGFGAPAGGGLSSGFGQTKTTSFSLPASSTTTLGGGFGGGGFGQSTTAFGAPAAGGGFGGTSFGQPAQQFGMAGNLQQQQQQQYMMQMAAQQPQSVASKIDLLRRKKDELTQGITSIEAQQQQLQQLQEERTAPNLFAGFSGGKTTARTIQQLQSVGGVGRAASTRVAPRGMQSSPSPAVTPVNNTTGSVSTTPRLLLLNSPAPTPVRLGYGSSATPSFNRGGVPPTPDTGFSTRGGDAKKLLLHPYGGVGSRPDPTEDLPPAQHFNNRNGNHQMAAPTVSGVGGVSSPVRSNDNATATPMRGGAFTGSSSTAMNLASAQSTRYDPTGHNARLGDATGLTPCGSSATPLATSAYSSREVHVIEDDEHSLPRHISFQNSPTKRTPTSTPRTVEREPLAEPPVLTKAGYFTSPDMSVLNRMTDTELSHVKQFVVYRPNVGQIEWEGTVDVRGLDLDAIVRIDKKEVFVYEGVEDPSPPLGVGLNKPAVITLSNVFPKEGCSESKAMAYVQKLEDFCVMNDATFLSYSLESGDWVFAVRHFSRYGLDDDSDDEDEPVEERQETSAERDIQQEQQVGNMTPSDTIHRLRSILVRDSPSDRQHQPMMQEHVSSPVTFGVSYNTAFIGMQEEQEQEQQTPRSEQKKGRQRLPNAWMNDDSAREEAQERQTAARESAKRNRTALLTEGVSSMDELRARLREARPERAFLSTGESHSVHALRDAKELAARARGMGHAAAELSSYTKPSLQSGQQQRGITDFGLSMGRSFRVGWSADGKIVHPGKLIFAKNDDAYGRVHRIVVETVDPLRWTDRRFPPGDTQSVCPLEQSLDALLSASHKESTLNPSTFTDAFILSTNTNAASAVRGSQQLPLWKAPLADPSELHEYIPFLRFLKTTVSNYQDGALRPDHPDWHACKALELVNATYGQEKISISSDPVQRAFDVVPLFEDRPAECPPEMWERRRTALSKWLESVIAPQVSASSPVDDGSAGHSAQTYQRIFDLLSCHRLDDAVAVAENAGLYRLATLLSQADGDASLPTLMRNQLEIWRYSGADKTIPVDLLRIYRLLGASPVIETEHGVDSILLGLGWLRAIGVLFWYCSKNDSFVDNVGTLSASLESYRILLADELVDKPRTSFSADQDPLGADVEYPFAKHGLYHLLELLFPSHTAALPGAMDEEVESSLVADTERKVRACLAPGGFTRDALDYRTSYLLLVLLESAGIADEMSSYALIVRQHMIFQLLSAGLWQWALFVALQIRDDASRCAISRDIVLRWGGQKNWEEISSSTANNPNQFVMNSLNIPERWVHEATALRCGYQFDHSSQVTYLNFAHQWAQAKQVLCIHIAPGAILASDRAASNLLNLLESIEQAETEDHVSLSGDRSDTWTNLSHLFLSFLRLREFVESISQEDLIYQLEGNSRGQGEEVMDQKLEEVLAEARQLLSRLSDFQKQQEVLKQNQGSDVFQSQSKLGTALIYDMGTYLYRVISKLVTLTPPSQQDPAERLALISQEFFATHYKINKNISIRTTAPVHDDALLSTFNQFSYDYFQDAASRVMQAIEV